jgi:FtsP/CotA-like multicopper oxidase with cupredoxin domain
MSRLSRRLRVARHGPHRKKLGQGFAWSASRRPRGRPRVTTTASPCIVVVSGRAHKAYSSGPGPTLEVRSGQPVLVEWSNELPTRHFLPIDQTLHGTETDKPEVRTVVHLRGGRTGPESDGYPESWFAPGQVSHGPDGKFSDSLKSSRITYIPIRPATAFKRVTPMAWS